MTTPSATRTRFYMRTPDGVYRALLWLYNYRANEMVFGFYPLRGNERSTLRVTFPERNATREEIPSIRYSWSDGQSVKIPVEHFSCHGSGAFHLKIAGGGAGVYSHVMAHSTPLDADTPRFLHFQVLTSPASLYAPVRPKYPHAWVAVDAPRSLLLDVMFSGGHHPLEVDMGRRVAVLGLTQRELISVRFGALRGLVLPRQLTGRTGPPGTVVSFNFVVGEDEWHLKTFVFD